MLTVRFNSCNVTLSGTLFSHLDFYLNNSNRFLWFYTNNIVFIKCIYLYYYLISLLLLLSSVEFNY